MNSIESLLTEVDQFSPEKKKELARQVYKQSLFHTCKYLLGFQDINWRTHGDAIEALEGLATNKNKSALIIMPRGSLKSSIGSVAFPIWLLLRDPNLRIMIDSETYELSTQFLSEIAQYLETHRLIDLFGIFRSSDDWSGKSLTIRQRTKILKESSVVASGVGSPKTGSHFDVILFDDLNSQRNSATPELRDKVWRHYQMAYAVLEPYGITAVIATRYSADDVPGRILEKEIGIDYLPDHLKSVVSR